jgi:hypothetical protein
MEVLENLSHLCTDRGLPLPADLAEDLSRLVEAEETGGAGKLHV